MDRDVLEFLAELVNQVTLSASSPELLSAAQLVDRAKQQLTDELDKETD